MVYGSNAGRGGYYSFTTLGLKRRKKIESENPREISR